MCKGVRFVYRAAAIVPLGGSWDNGLSPTLVPAFPRRHPAPSRVPRVRGCPIASPVRSRRLDPARSIQAAGPEAVSRADFAHELRDALDHLHDVVALHAHRFADLAAKDRPPGALSRGDALRRDLLAAIDGCQPAATMDERAARRYRSLLLRYVDGKEPAEAQRDLALSRTQYYRELQSAVDG